MTDWNGWLKLVAEEVLLVIAFAVVLEGCRRLMRDGVSRAPALMVALGLILPVWEASASLHLIKDVARLQAEKMARLNIYLHEPGGGWEKADLTPEQRTGMSTMVAGINFKFFGRYVDVIDAQGKRVAFEPPREMVAEREQIVRNEKGAEDAATAAFDRGTHLFISAAGFMLVGLAVGWRQRLRARRGA
jgi:hypothetical protein